MVWIPIEIPILIDSTNSVAQDTIRGFNNAFNFSVNANMSTKVYGQFNFGGKVKAIRHVLTPNIGMSYTLISVIRYGAIIKHISPILGNDAYIFGVQLVFVWITGKRDAGKCQFRPTEHLGDEGQKQEGFHGCHQGQTP